MIDYLNDTMGYGLDYHIFDEKELIESVVKCNKNVNPNKKISGFSPRITRRMDTLVDKKMRINIPKAINIP